MAGFEGVVVANVKVKLGDKIEDVVLIKTTDGDRIWRTEDELAFLDPELERKWQDDYHKRIS